MNAIKNYPIDIVKRTKKLLEQRYDDIAKENELEVTFLVNCLQGLVVAVSEVKEKAFNKEMNEDFLAYVPNRIGFFKKSDIKVKNILDNPTLTTPHIYGKNDLKRCNKEWFVTKLRNAISHQHISATNDGGQWVGVIMWNEPADGIVDFEIHLTVDELKKLAIKIADDYLEARDSKPKFKKPIDYK